VVSFGQCLVSVVFWAVPFEWCLLDSFSPNIHNILSLCFLSPKADLVENTYSVTPYSFKLIYRCSSLAVEFLNAFRIHIYTPFMHLHVFSGSLLNSFRPSDQCTCNNSKADERIFMKCGIGEFYLKLLLNFSFCLNELYLTVTVCTSALI
jgi:hypothetical protein